MEEKVDIMALGELLIDFTEAGHSQGEMCIRDSQYIA